MGCKILKFKILKTIFSFFLYFKGFYFKIIKYSEGKRRVIAMVWRCMILVGLWLWSLMLRGNNKVPSYFVAYTIQSFYYKIVHHSNVNFLPLEVTKLQSLNWWGIVFNNLGQNWCFCFKYKLLWLQLMVTNLLILNVNVNSSKS